jgi:hypothetical protein
MSNKHTKKKLKNNPKETTPGRHLHTAFLFSMGEIQDQWASNMFFCHQGA